MLHLPSFLRFATVSAFPTLALLGTFLFAFNMSGWAESPYTPVSKSQPNYEITDRGARSSKWKKVWQWSAAALVAGSTMDVASSYGYAEANGMLRSGSGQLQGRGTAIKFGVLGAALIGQHYLLRKNPELQKPLAITNFAIGAAYSGVAVRNWRVR